MFDLSTSEKKIVIILLTILLLGLGFSAYKKSRSRADIKIGSFGMEGEDLHRRININTADPDELASLKGVGKILAGRIMEYRSQKGRFGSIDDIKNVKGVGPALFDKLKDDITVE
ncbi:MAG: ComEA family DNA-binding protein [Candidatus Omnitrophica bacterium]|nr:ComEA family DNA-binding protein [Candidatus Omnitrophota bacterium]